MVPESDGVLGATTRAFASDNRPRNTGRPARHAIVSVPVDAEGPGPKRNLAHGTPPALDNDTAIRDGRMRIIERLTVFAR